MYVLPSSIGFCSFIVGISNTFKEYKIIDVKLSLIDQVANEMIPISSGDL